MTLGATPRVLCVMLADGRQQMVERAIRSFTFQAYENRKLLILDSGAEPLALPVSGMGYYHVKYRPQKKASIGTLRNLANMMATAGALDCELIAHWDSDDWSHPQRLLEQVALLQESESDCVGYSDMVFWNWRAGGFRLPGEAWLFTAAAPGYVVGTSLLYTRKIVERFPFPDRDKGEDTLWLLEKRIKRTAASSLTPAATKMVAAIHGGNTTSEIKPGAKEWRRAPEWDTFCAEVMEL